MIIESFYTSVDLRKKELIIMDHTVCFVFPLHTRTLYLTHTTLPICCRSNDCQQQVDGTLEFDVWIAFLGLV